MPLSPIPPIAKMTPMRIEQLGRVRVDEYAWMKDENWQKVMRDPKAIRADIREHLEAENAYTKAMLASTEDLQKTLFEEMKGRIKEDDSSLPQPDGPFDYYVRYAIGAQHPIYARRPRGTEDGETMLIDADALSKDKPFFNLAAADHSPDHKLFAYAVDEQGSEYHRIYLKDLASGETLPEPIESADDGFVFSPDSQWLFWVWRDENARSSKVFRRPARGGAKDDVLVYHETDEGMFVHLDETRSRAFILITAGDHETSAAWLIPASDPTAEPQIVEPRTQGLMYSVEHWDDRFIIHTNADGAVDFKLVTAPVDGAGRANWKEWIAHRPGHFIMGAAAFAEHFVRVERVDANHRIVITDRATLTDRPIPIDEEAYALSIDTGYEYDTPILRYVYQSPTTPRSWFDYDMTNGETVLRKTQDIPSGHEPNAYVAKCLFAKAADGEAVPITILMKAGTPLDGSAPMLLYGYGSYGLSMDPSFSIRSLSLVDRGWIWAIAHVRGGSEKGWGWFLDGRGMKKTHTFTDLIACAEHLTAEGYGAKGRIVAYGGSAGGMLVGAVANLRPDLWAGVIGAVPFVDVLNTMSDTTLPLTPPEWPEWGNPLTDPAAYDYIASYSPYDNVVALPYPAILATGGLSDPRVTYWEPAKWAAKLRAHTTSDRPVLLKINMEAGHGGSAGRFESLKEVALDYAFAIQALDPAFVAKLEAPMIVRPAAPADTAAITAIYGYHVLHGLGTFEEAPPTEADMAARMTAVQGKALPYLVAEKNGEVLGFAYAAPFRPRSAYRFTAEDSVYIAPHALSQGVGKTLLSAVIQACEAIGVRQLTAVIGDTSNAASIGLHAALGFERTGSSQSVGYKHGRWVDIVFMQKALNGGDRSPPIEPGIAL